MAENIHPIFDRLLDRAVKEKVLNQHSKVIWLTGLSGSGKSTIAQQLQKELFGKGFFVEVLDGDNIRSGINSNLTFSEEDRCENIRRIAEVAKLFKESGIICLCSFISPLIAMRQKAKQIIGEKDFIEVFIDTPIAICEQRDVKGLYKKARKGEIKGFTGIDAPFEAPTHPDIRIPTNELNIEQSVGIILDQILPLLTFTPNPT